MPVEEWTVGGTALTSLMDVERRHGRLQLAILDSFISLMQGLNFSFCFLVWPLFFLPYSACSPKWFVHLHKEYD